MAQQREARTRLRADELSSRVSSIEQTLRAERERWATAAHCSERCAKASHARTAVDCAGRQALPRRWRSAEPVLEALSCAEADQVRATRRRKLSSKNSSVASKLRAVSADFGDVALEREHVRIQVCLNQRVDHVDRRLGQGAIEQLIQRDRVVHERGAARLARQARGRNHHVLCELGGARVLCQQELVNSHQDRAEPTLGFARVPCVQRVVE